MEAKLRTMDDYRKEMERTELEKEMARENERVKNQNEVLTSCRERSRWNVK